MVPIWELLGSNRTYSHVPLEACLDELAAMGLDARRIDTALRVSLCAENTEADVDALLNGLEQGLKTLAQLR